MTVATIARLAGVSAPTVSKVLNGRTGVASATRRRVEAVLREHGYRRPDAVGRAPILEVLFHALESHLAIEIMRGVERVAREHELAVGFTEMSGRTRAGRGWIDQVLRAAADRGHRGLRRGHRATSRPSSRRAESRWWRWTRPASRCTRRRRSARRTGAAASPRPGTCSSSGTGGSRVIGGPADFLCARARLDGFRAAMDARRASPVDPELVRVGQVLLRGRPRHGPGRCSRCPTPPTAVFCGNDLQALGVYEAARRAGVRIPARPERGRLRRPGVRPLVRPAADHGPPAAGRDGRGRRRHWCSTLAAGEHARAAPGRARHRTGRAGEHRGPVPSR